MPLTIEPTIVAPSAVLGNDVRNAFAQDSGEPPSDYYGEDGELSRGDLGGLTLSTVPKVLIECANMRNATDAARLTTPAWRQSAAQGISDGISAFLTGELQV